MRQQAEYFGVVKRQQLFLLLLMTSIEYTFKNILCLPERNFCINNNFC